MRTILLLLVPLFAFAGDFTTFYSVLSSWFLGNLGKLLALFGFFGTFFVYMLKAWQGSRTDDLTSGFLIRGCFISLLAGGIVGIANTFYDAGHSLFG